MKEKKLLAEELKKFKMLAEYSFFIPDEDVLEEDNEEIEGEPEVDAEGGLDMGAGEEGGEPDLAFDDSEMDSEMENPEPGPEPEAAIDGEPDMGDLPEPEGEVNIGDEGMEDMEGEPEMESGEEEIELDVTELVTKSEEATQAAEEANEKLAMLMQKFGELEGRIPKMDSLGQQLDVLQKEIERRNPTEVEKLEMRSMNSFPYNIKLSDYWEDKEPQNYDIGDNKGGKSNQEQEYVLTKDDVNSDYSEMSVKNTFDYKEEDI
jgi:hypothetical protein